MNEQQANPTHSFLIEDAIRLGSIEKAIILKEIRGMVLYKDRNGKGKWVYYSQRALADKFPYMASRSIGRWLQELEDGGELESTIQNKFKYDKTKSYTLCHFRESVRQNGSSDDQNGATIPPLSTPQSLNSVANAPLDYVLEEENPKPAKKKKVTPEIQSVFDLFTNNPARFQWRLYESEREAAAILHREYGPEELKIRYDVARKYRNEEMCPQIHSPSEFLEKMPKMELFLTKKSHA